MTNEWFKFALLVALGFFVYKASVFMDRMAWSTAYAERGECLERIYARGDSDFGDTKANCFDIIAKLNGY